MTVNTMPMGPGVLTLGDVGDVKSLSSQVTNVRLSPSVDLGDPINVLSGESAPGDRDETFTLAGTIVQDLGAGAAGVDSIVEWLYNNAGDLVPFTFTPNTAKGRAITGSLTIEAVEIGGDVKTKPTSDFEWAVSGRPAIGAVGA